MPFVLRLVLFHNLSPSATSADRLLVNGLLAFGRVTSFGSTAAAAAAQGFLAAHGFFAAQGLFGAQGLPAASASDPDERTVRSRLQAMAFMGGLLVALDVAT